MKTFNYVLSAILLMLTCCSGKDNNSAEDGMQMKYRATTLRTDPDSSLVGYCQSGFRVGQALYTDDDLNQYVAYYDGNHELTVAQRTLPDGPWSYVRTGSKVGWDSHNYITMIKDSRGCLHVTGNMHAAPLVFFSTDHSGDISTLKRVTSLLGDREDRVTYPKFIRLSDGRIIFHYRDGKSGSGAEIYDILDDDGKWHRHLDTPLADGKRDCSAYFIDPVAGPDGKYHICWVWRDTPMCETNHDISYAFTEDFRNWYASDGTLLTLPISPADSRTVVDMVPAGGGCLNGGQRIGFDKNGNPFILYYKYYDEDGNESTTEDVYSQIFIAHRTKYGWKSEKLTSGTWKWEFSGGGSLEQTRISIGVPSLEPDGTITVVYTFSPEDSAPKSRELWIDGSTFTTIRESIPRSSPSRYDPWVGKIHSTYAGEGKIDVRTSSDITGKPYIIRWESLGQFRDQKPDVEIPDPSELRVVKCKY